MTESVLFNSLFSVKFATTYSYLVNSWLLLFKPVLVLIYNIDRVCNSIQTMSALHIRYKQIKKNLIWKTTHDKWLSKIFAIFVLLLYLSNILILKTKKYFLNSFLTNILYILSLNFANKQWIRLPLKNRN